MITQRFVTVTVLVLLWRPVWSAEAESGLLVGSDTLRRDGQSEQVWRSSFQIGVSATIPRTPVTAGTRLSAAMMRDDEDDLEFNVTDKQDAEAWLGLGIPGSTRAAAYVGYGLHDSRPGWRVAVNPEAGLFRFHGYFVGGEVRVAPERGVGAWLRATWYPALNGAKSLGGLHGDGHTIDARLLVATPPGDLSVGYRRERYGVSGLGGSRSVSGNYLYGGLAVRW